MKYYVADVFTDVVFGGNPAGVSYYGQSIFWNHPISIFKQPEELRLPIYFPDRSADLSGSARCT